MATRGGEGTDASSSANGVQHACRPVGEVIRVEIQLALSVDRFTWRNKCPIHPNPFRVASLPATLCHIMRLCHRPAPTLRMLPATPWM